VDPTGAHRRFSSLGCWAMFCRWSHPLNERAVAVLGHGSPHVAAATAQPKTPSAYFPFSPLAAFLVPFFLAIVASFPSGWTDRVSKFALPKGSLLNS